MIEVQKLNAHKEKILSTIRMQGPSLPVQIAREIEFSPLFASAFLSELKGEGRLAMSNLRVGSSPLYYIPGQEEQLTKFVAYLNQREKEAFHKLKSEGILEDSAQDPVMRVALRAIKDFAHAVKVRVNGEQRLYWRYFTLKDEDVMRKISGLAGVSEEKKDTDSLALAVAGQEDAESSEESREERMAESVNEEGEEAVEKKIVTKQETLDDERPLAEKKLEKVKDNEFAVAVKDFLGAKDVEIMHVISEKKKEFEAKVRIDTQFGRQTYYLIAKDKKRVSDGDLANALTKARGEKLPAVFVSQGELNKKARDHLEQWGNLVRFEQIDFGENS